MRLPQPGWISASHYTTRYAAHYSYTFTFISCANMRFRLLMLTILAASCQYAPDSVWASSYEDVQVLFDYIVLNIERTLIWLAEAICPYLWNMNNFVTNQSSLWLLFFQPCTIYGHTKAGVVKSSAVKKVRFVIGVYAVSFVCIMLLGSLVLDVLPLSCPGEYYCLNALLN